MVKGNGMKIDIVKKSTVIDFKAKIGSEEVKVEREISGPRKVSMDIDRVRSRLGTFSQFKLKNGIKVFHRRNSFLPMVIVGLVINGGSSIESAKHSGITELTLRSILDNKVAEDIRKNGGKLEHHTFRDFSILKLKTLSDDLEINLRLLGKLLCSPVLSRDVVNRVSRYQKSDIKSVIGGSFENLIERIYRIIFGKSGYGLSVFGTVSGVRKTTYRDVQRWYKKIFSSSNVSIFVIGDYDERTLRGFLGDDFSSIKHGKRVENPIIKPKESKAKVKGNNLSILAYAVDIGDGEKYSLLKLITYYINNEFSKTGFPISAWYPTMGKYSLLIISASDSTFNFDRIVDRLVEEASKMTEGEFQNLKSKFIKNYLLHYRSMDSILAYSTTYYGAGFPLNFDGIFLGKVSSISLDCFINYIRSLR
jgi:hypothetical protein